jgi:hypothetical protein
MILAAQAEQVRERHGDGQCTGVIEKGVFCSHVLRPSFALSVVSTSEELRNTHTVFMQ